MTKLIKLATFSAAACALSLSTAGAATTAGEPATQSLDDRVVLAQSRMVTFSHERIQTDIYSSESLARSMLRTLVGNRLAEECQNRFNSSLLWDTIEYTEFWDGTMGSNRYRASTNQAWGNCR